jgi:nucleoside-diphosphate-sugar epimerase
VRVAVVGSSGFIGSHIKAALEAAGHTVVAIGAPRIRSRARDVRSLQADVEQLNPAVLRSGFRGCDAVVNAAGVAEATSSDRDALYGANATLPVLLRQYARAEDVGRFVHISSAAVQGRRRVLNDRPEYGARSPYAASKALAEQALLAQPTAGLVIYRPTSVHGEGRAVTERLRAFARSRWAIVASPGSDPTPQIHVAQVAEAVRALVETSASPPVIVLHPWEGFTTSTFLGMLRGRPVPEVPRWVAKGVIGLAFAVSFALRGRLWAHARRLEVLLVGQRQERSWLEGAEPGLLKRDPRWADICGT